MVSWWTVKSKRNSYTVEFHDGDTVLFGYVVLFITNRAKQYAVIQKFTLKELPICVPQENTLSDIVSTFGDVQEFLDEYSIPVSETDNLVAVSLDSIDAQVVCKCIVLLFYIWHLCRIQLNVIGLIWTFIL